MKIAGIIAEYNPFHNGHAYQAEELKKRTGADYVIAAMSGDFMQRGAPAMMDKYARTRMALSAGIDLVVELPTLWSVASAEYFAAAGAALFDKTGCVDLLCFGTETDHPSLFTEIAAILAKEPAEYKNARLSFQKKGFSFPLAREYALANYLSKRPAQDKNTYTKNDSPAGEPLHELLSSPNNILALEYQKALLLRGSSMIPFPIQRKGAGYHEPALGGTFASASAIRKLLNAATLPSPDQYLPHTSCRIIEDYHSCAAFLDSDDFSSILGYQLLFSDTETLAQTADCNPDIANRLKKNLCSFSSFSQFCAKNKSRNLTYTRISRILSHVLLGHTTTDYARFAAADYTPYLRILGFKKEAGPLLKTLKKSADIPLISKLADARKFLSDEAFALLEKDIFAADLYEQVKFQKSRCKGTVSNEYARGLVILSPAQQTAKSY